MTGNEGDKRSRSPFGFTFIAPLALGATLNPINTTMLSTALVPIAESLHVGVAKTGWLIAALYLTTAVAQPTMGRLVDLLGPRRIYLMSLFLVAAAGVCGGLASSLAGLVAVRVLLGVFPHPRRPDRIQAATRRHGHSVAGGIFDDRSRPADRRCSHQRLWLAVDLHRQCAARAAPGPALDSKGSDASARFRAARGRRRPHRHRAFRCLPPEPRGLPDEPQDRTVSGWFLSGAVIFGAALVFHARRRRQPFIDVRMLARNRPLTMTYLRAGAVAMIVFSIYYGFAQWLQSAVGLVERRGRIGDAAHVGGGRGLVADRRAHQGAARALPSQHLARLPAYCLLFVDSGTSIWIIVTAITFFGLPLGTFSTATQAAVYVQAPAAEIGTAAGLQRTAQYIGAIGAASMLASIYGQRASDHGLHSLAAVMGRARRRSLPSSPLFDRTIPRVWFRPPSREVTTALPSNRRKKSCRWQNSTTLPRWS